MSKVWAITTCRVSTPEQVANNSLKRQAEATLKAAEELGAYIPDDGQWSGNVSSKAGTNVNRKDIKDMLTYCRKHPQVKYLIVHEVDRFMRSVDELFHFEVEFRKLGVKVWYASQPELNTDNINAKLFKALKAFEGEGSNEERQKKSVDGDVDALKEGRYPFAPKPGYMKGSLAGIQEIHPVRGPALRLVLVRLATKLISPSQALTELNNSDFMLGHSPYKMDKFRKIATDPFNAGIVDVNKQVKVRNENGLHEPLITKAQHYELIRIMDSKKKNQSGPRMNGNPKYPCNNDVTCDLCLGKKNCRFVGFDHGNGKPNSTKIYEKYRCRACGRYITREAMHLMVEDMFKGNIVSNEGLKHLLKALDKVWEQQENDAQQESVRLRHKLKILKDSISQQVDAATDPLNASIKEDILAAITRKKEEAGVIEEQIDKLETNAEQDMERFLCFAFEFINNIGGKYLEMSPENRLRCKQIVFPAGFHLDKNKKVYTPEISPLISLAGNKKARTNDVQAHLVQV